MDNDSPVDKLIDEQLASDINEILETVEAGVGSFDTHTKDLNNPHQTTKEQVGLGNVDNTSDMDKPVSNAVASAINTLEAEMETERGKIYSAIETLNTNTGLAFQGVTGAIYTLAQENEAEHTSIHSAINTLREENEAEHTSIHSAIETFKEENENLSVMVSELNSQILGTQSAVQTLDKTNQQEHQDTLSLLDEKITEVKGLITALDNKIISATATLKALFAEADTAVKNEVTTAYQTKDTELQTAIDGKAASDHNHDSVYAKIGTAALADGSVKSNHIAANAITAAKIANKTITAAQVADNTFAASTHSHDAYSETTHTHSGISVDMGGTGTDSSVGYCVGQGMNANGGLMQIDYCPSSNVAGYSLPAGEYVTLQFRSTTSDKVAQMAISLTDGSLRTRKVNLNTSFHGAWQIK